ncbi:MAG: hypothetical protein AB1446_09980 [Bacillota bacterium]
MKRVTHLKAAVKAILCSYIASISRGPPPEYRPCHCGHHFRHRHKVEHCYVAVGFWSELVPVLYLRCPACGSVRNLRPRFLPPRSPYPWVLRQEAILAYRQLGSYRRAAAAFEINWQTLWRWADRLARAAERLERFLLEQLLACNVARTAALAQEAGRLTPARAGPGWRTRAISRAPLLLELALSLWQEGSRLGLNWGEPQAEDAMRFLGVCARETGLRL